MSEYTRVSTRTGRAVTHESSFRNGYNAARTDVLAWLRSHKPGDTEVEDPDYGMMAMEIENEFPELKP